MATKTVTSLLYVLVCDPNLPMLKRFVVWPEQMVSTNYTVAENDASICEMTRALSQQRREKSTAHSSQRARGGEVAR